MSLPAVIALQAAAPPPAAPGAGFLEFVPFILIFFIFYVLWIRPQSRQQKEKEAQIKAIEKGDLVVSAGGLHGRVVGVTDDVLSVEIADRVRVKLDRARVERVEKAKKGEAT